jgi:murein L,D-transpeptidase YcbB/YkuD
MHIRTMIPALTGATALLAVAGAFSAGAEEAGDAAVVTYSMYDRVVDPTTVAIRAMLADAGTRGEFLDKRDAAGVAEFYAEQGYAPTWTDAGKLTERARAIILRLRQAGADGLDPAAYRTPFLGIGRAHPASVHLLARAEVMLSQAIVTYVRHARSGRVDPASISNNIGYKPHLVDPVAALARVAGDPDPAAALASFNPQHPEYLALRARLAEIRASDAERPPVVAAGPNLKLGSRDPRILVLRERLNLPLVEAAPAEETTAAAVADPDAETAQIPVPVAAMAGDAVVVAEAEPVVEEPAPVFDPEVFDAIVDEAVRAFQESAGLRPDGIVGPATLGVLNAAAEDHVDTIIANMERWRWMPEDLGRFYVRVNVPNFNLDVYRGRTVAYTTRIVVGKPSNQTPIFSDEIEHVIVNPIWNVPASIAVKEMLPEVQANPGALRGYNVYANINGRFRAVDPYMIDWHRVDMRKIQIKQPPGERNALGRVKFMFPNQFAVYLHDTPSKSLFERDYRAYSHGCMRVMNPWDFADALLANEPELNSAGLKKLIGGGEKRKDLSRTVPVHVTYFTAWIDEAGDLQVRDDLYGHDKRLQQALAL